ncbi:ATP-binding protein [Sporosalibacterium faouarense]|uniref:ATP-binding protein n=1 Tax=Sporosalibacterium faouarense TaxID=516123 RepID=UPI00192B04DA
MKQLRKMLLIGISISLVSEVYINLFSDSFRVSLSVIIFPLFLLIYKNINIVKTSLITGSTVFIFRSFLLLVSNNNINYIIRTNYAVILFYVLYGVLFYIMRLRDDDKKLGNLFLGICTCDFIANLSEIILRVNSIKDIEIPNVLRILIIIAIIRGFIVTVIINALKYYKLLIVKKEHEERYRNLILMISNLKSEIYFMKKNSDYIENVMRNSYQLYEGISKSKEISDMENLALTIAKDVHEIKKDYERVIKGIEALFENEFKYNIMSMKTIMNILEQSTLKMLISEKKDIDLKFQLEEDFKTDKHYALISILRNLINNAIEAVGNIDNKGQITVIQLADEEKYFFRVIDNGIGIKDENKELIFKPGFSTKFNSITGDIYRGLGLALVRDIVKNYFQGNIEVHSNNNRGTIFEVEIPRKALEV